MRLIFTTIIFINFIFNQDSEIENGLIGEYQENKALINSYYKNKKEFMLILKNGNKYKISEVLSIDEKNETYQFNILNTRFSNPTFHKKNISKVSNYTESSKGASMLMKVHLKDILLVESVNYDSEIREAKIYSLIIIGMYLVFSAFFS